MAKIAWLVRHAYGNDEYSRWEIVFTEPHYYSEVKQIVYFEVENNNG